MPEDEERWTLGYEAEGSDDAAWVLRHGAGPDTTVYEVNTDLGPDERGAVFVWATLTLDAAHDVAVGGWEPHRPGPGTAPDYWTAKEA
jgi:hypothetical protein